MTDKPDLKVVDIGRPGLQNVPAMLRNLAKDIEDGKYGDWQEVAFVMNYSDGFSVYGWGLPEAPRAAMLLQAGVARFSEQLIRKCRDY